MSPCLAMVIVPGPATGVYGDLPASWCLLATFLSEAAAPACIGIINSYRNLGGFVGNYAMVFKLGVMGYPSFSRWRRAAPQLHIWNSPLHELGAPLAVQKELVQPSAIQATINVCIRP